ncbi:MAG: dimethylmenaquinone methyltransferase [Rhodomicrobium sp.]|nr:MAG: dimethylmenaquinone methyltransferase [Rhodomicrobium sp.]
MVDNKHFKTILTARRQELAETINTIEDRLDDPKDPDVEERATEREEDEVLETREKQSAEEIHAIDQALDRIEDGTFGICSICHEAISQARLDAVPYTNVCRNCMSG